MALNTLWTQEEETKHQEYQHLPPPHKREKETIFISITALPRRPQQMLIT